MDRTHQVNHEPGPGFKRTAFVFMIGCLMACTSLYSDEVEVSDRLDFVKKSQAEWTREEISAALGDLTQYTFIWLHPESVQVNAIRKVAAPDENFEILHWTRAMRPEQILSAKVTPAEIDKLALCFDELMKETKGSPDPPDRELEDYAHPDRILLFKRFRNVNVWDWQCLSIRSNSKNQNFEQINKIMLSACPRDNDEDLEESLPE